MITYAKPFDYDQIQQFYLDICHDLEVRENYPLWQWGLHPTKEMIEEAIEQGELLLFSNDDLELDTDLKATHPFYGAAIVNTNHEEGQSVAWSSDQAKTIHLFAIHPDLAGHHLADQFLAEIIELAQTQNLASLHLDVIDGNWPAKNLYVRHGFQSLGIMDIHTEHDVQDVLTFEFMELNLGKNR